MKKNLVEREIRFKTFIFLLIFYIWDVFFCGRALRDRSIIIPHKHTFVYENYLDDRVMRNVDLMRAHAVSAAISWPIITVAELFRWDVIDLWDRWRRRKREWDLIHERNHMVTSRRNYGHNQDNKFYYNFIYNEW